MGIGGSPAASWHLPYPKYILGQRCPHDRFYKKVIFELRPPLLARRTLRVRVASVLGLRPNLILFIEPNNLPGGIRTLVVRLLPKQEKRVRFSYPAPLKLDNWPP